jgi:hypothetical protein
VGRAFEWGKGGLRGWGAAIEQRVREGFLGPKIRKPSHVGLDWLTNGRVFQDHIEGACLGQGMSIGEGRGLRWSTHNW